MISGGGTGGHVYPALAVAQELLARGDEVLWVGRPGSLEESLVGREGIPFWPVEAGALRGRNPLLLPVSLVRLGRGLAQALVAVGRHRPAAFLATGGYVSAPAVGAARLRRVPVLVYLPDMEPGLAVRLLSRLAQRVAVSFPEVGTHFPGRPLQVSGYPVRAALRQGDRGAARVRLDLPQGARVVLVMGGSQGARSINRAVARGLGEILPLAWLVHVAGRLDFQELLKRREGLEPRLRERYRVYDYLHEEMTDAMLAADLAVARAGAATLGEFPNAGLPSVLVPYPFAGHHQRVNARYLETHGAAVSLLDEEVQRGALPPAVVGLLEDEPRLEAMARASRGLAVPDAAARLASALHELAA